MDFCYSTTNPVQMYASVGKAFTIDSAMGDTHSASGMLSQSGRAIKAPERYGCSTPIALEEQGEANPSVFKVTARDNDLQDADYDESGNSISSHRQQARTSASSNKTTSAQAAFGHSQEDIIALIKRNDTLSATLKDIRKKRTSERKGIVELKEQLRESLRREKASQRCLAEISSQLTQKQVDFQKELLDKEARFAKAEIEMRQRLPKDTLEALPDDVVKTKFKVIQMAVIDWCKEWSLSDCRLVDDDLVTNAIKSVTYDLCDPEIKWLCKLFRTWKAGPRVLLTTYVMRFTFGNQFQRPFSFLEYNDQDSVREVQCRKLYNILLRGDRKVAEAWRVDTIRALVEVNRLGNAGPQTTSSPANSSMRSTKHLVEECLRQIMPFSRSINDQQAAKRQEEFETFYEQAKDLALRLWCQKTSMKVAWNDVWRTRFAIRSEMMEPHSSMGLDEDDERFDGEFVDLVICPAIIASGNSDGNGYEHSKVWMKAIVKIFHVAE